MIFSRDRFVGRTAKMRPLLAGPIKSVVATAKPADDQVRLLAMCRRHLHSIVPAKAANDIFEDF
jgi:hypothetical protein